MAMCEQPALRQDNRPNLSVPFKKVSILLVDAWHILFISEAVQVIGLFQEACTKVSGK